MKSVALLLSVAASLAAASAIAVEHEAHVRADASITLPRSAASNCNPHKQKDNWGNAVEKDRKRITIRASKNDRDDISDEFLSGIKRANNGGLLHLEKDKTYVIGKKLDLSFLKDVYVKIDGELKFTDNITYWQANNFFYSFQNSITFWVWGGRDIKIYGSGTINGNGQAWWDGFAGHEILDPNNAYYRPILFLTDNATNVEVRGIHMKDSPCWNNFFVRSKNVIFDDVYISAVSTNASSLPKNTDGFDSFNVDGLTVTNTRVNVGDDCFSPKPNTTNILVQNLWCNGTHGVSMGSIGQYAGVKDIISNALLQNITLLNGQNGARLKAWAGADVGYGYISNITYRDIHVENTDNPIVLDQCYFNVNQTECAAHPSRVNITDVRFINVHGTSSGKNGRVVADLTCSPGATCTGIYLQDINITSPAGSPPEIVCDGIQGGIGVPCVSASEA
ncbi:c14a0449-38b5-4bf8-9954-82965c1cd184 [Thermothielavioides terrestris]|uniref:galacturonan 1,4-alpha-galacturonidase n=2 Tax=Thermothielavioides terrestris TaxID=2587410 RepID=G2R8A1_THETT|nr:glycoside hydrolase family 28 protein [Thermothielavioides terrestris NRRL 8126]AEO68160.1 glycoside hydrolase family 28 protein [Thermothielavioides terrestris NRRL 8126]SPQ24592.1 c14a0449-38b5-4bf8-9954-82965c1cd184 [Thermothielavioides terrestris]